MSIQGKVTKQQPGVDVYTFGSQHRGTLYCGWWTCDK